MPLTAQFPKLQKTKDFLILNLTFWFVEYSLSLIRPSKDKHRGCSHTSNVTLKTMVTKTKNKYKPEHLTDSQPLS